MGIRALFDPEDEVRERVLFHLNILENSDEDLSSSEQPVVVDFLELQNSLVQYFSSPSNFETPFSLQEAEQKITQLQLSKSKNISSTGSNIHHTNAGLSISGTQAVVGTLSDQDVSQSTSSQNQSNASEIAQHPGLAMYGKLFKSGNPVLVTESDSDYVVKCIVHSFAKHLVFQYVVTNTVQGQLLENVVVDCDYSSLNGVNKVATIPAQQVFPSSSASLYVCFQLKGDDHFNISGSVSNTLRFTLKEINETQDISEEGDEDEYRLEDFSITPNCFAKQNPTTDFRSLWEQMGKAESPQKIEIFALNFKSIAAAVAAIVDIFGMGANDGTDHVPETDQTGKHTLLCSGTYFPAVPVMIVTNFVLSQQSSQVQIRVTIRSESQQVCDALMSCVG
eukprot:c16279_g1_i1.p1 GENE.c16279_g1_i1~~c16279_g1_i1.p1  ORF type:complete len:393 (+),score=205.07 c16279_g1_i1:1-1179(+)